MKKWVLILVVISLAFALVAEEYDFTPEKKKGETEKIEPVDKDEKVVKSEAELLLQGDVLNVQSNNKDARLAMALSMLVPGVGNYYADKTSITTYIWPVLEIGLWAGYVYFRSEGDDKTDEYEKYADENYQRSQQHQIEGYLRNKYDSDVYDQTFWRLDDTNTQHFYEDIGKYDKYVFGWNDWYAAYATDNDGEHVEPIFYGDGDGTADYKWTGNQVMNDDYSHFPEDYKYSQLREKYIKMRKDAEDEYDMATAMTFGILMNHILSAADAIRLTVKHNAENLVLNDMKLEYAVVPRNNQMTPFVFLTKRF